MSMTMEPVHFLILAAIAGICGALGQAITGHSLGGLLVTVAVGFIGALVGLWLSRVFDLPELIALDIGGHRFPIVWSIVGSALFVIIIACFSKKDKKGG
jgi:uncharacterized membrane protein YeaQ/YmgE (transglycosylase-associated protein family)